MERDESSKNQEILAQSVDPKALAEAAFDASDTVDEAVDLLAARLSNERQTIHFLESVAAEQEAIIEEKNRQLTQDELGLERRDVFNEDIKTAFARFERDPEYTFAIGFFDLDNLKQVNDTIGHVTGGDHYLMRTVVALKSVLRAGDKLYRLGGDEILGLFYKMDEEDARVFGIRVREALDQEYEHLRSQLSQDPVTSTDFKRLQDSISMPFSVSLGMGFIRPDDSPETLLDRADKAMYEQKKATKQVDDKFNPIE